MQSGDAIKHLMKIKKLWTQLRHDTNISWPMAVSKAQGSGSLSAPEAVRFCFSLSISLSLSLSLFLSLSLSHCTDHCNHFFNAPLPLIQRLQNLFNVMMLHGRVPRQFQRGTIVPIVKDQQGDKSDLNNYRGITIAPLISKIFEHVLRIIYQPYLSTATSLDSRKNPPPLSLSTLWKRLSITTLIGVVMSIAPF